MLHEKLRYVGNGFYVVFVGLHEVVRQVASLWGDVEIEELDFSCVKTRSEESYSLSAV